MALLPTPSDRGDILDQSDIRRTWVLNRADLATAVAAPPPSAEGRPKLTAAAAVLGTTAKAERSKNLTRSALWQ